MEWLQEHATVVSASATVFMAIVWLLYAHVGIMAYLSHPRPRVIIDQTEERTVDTKFVIVNLREQPVYISCLMVAVEIDGEETVKQISRYYRFSSDEVHERPREVQAELRQGTLDSAEVLLLGDTDRLLAWMLDNDEDVQQTPRGDRLRRALSTIDSIEIRAISMVGAEDLPIASSRRFSIEKADGDILIYPQDMSTRHLTSWRDRTTVQEWSESCARP